MTAALIAAARAEAPNTLLFDNGDVIQGTPLGDYAANAWAKDKKAIHPMIAAMNELGYVAGTVGNHEFNYGLDLLDNVVGVAQTSRFSIASAEARRRLLFQALARSRARLQGRGRRGADAEDRHRRICHAADRAMGPEPFVGPRDDDRHRRSRALNMCPRCARSAPMSSSRFAIPAFRASAEFARRRKRRARARRGRGHRCDPHADISICCCRARTFAGIDGVDAARGALNNVPAFMPGFWGSHLGVIDLYLTRATRAGGSQNHRRRPADLCAQRRCDRAERREPDPRLLDVARGAHEATLAYVRSPVGEIVSPINSYFALVADDPSVQIVNAAQIWYVKQLAATLPALAGLPILSPPRRSNAADAAGRTIIPTSPRDRSRSRTSPISTSIPTACAS